MGMYHYPCQLCRDRHLTQTFNNITGQDGITMVSFSLNMGECKFKVLNHIFQTIMGTLRVHPSQYHTQWETIIWYRPKRYGILYRYRLTILHRAANKGNRHFATLGHCTHHTGGKNPHLSWEEDHRVED